MQVEKAITLSLGNLEQPVISKYQFGLTVNKIYRSKVYSGEPVNLHKDFAEKADISKHLKLLLNEGVLFQSSIFTRNHMKTAN